MSQLASAETAIDDVRRWPQRYTVVGLFFLGTVLCYLDRVNISIAIIPLASEGGYDPAAQGLILSAFFWGYLWTQLVGGWMADHFGGKRVLAAGVALWSIATFLTPVASASFAMLLLARALLGLGEGFNFPSIHSLAARWTPISERARALSLNYSGMHLGTVIALLASPAIVVRYGWQALFYVCGALGIAWLGAWLRWSADSPESSARISNAERELILSGRPAADLAAAVPWLKIAREPAVWAIVLAHVCHNWGFNILLLWLPTYLNKVLDVPLAMLGGYALIPWLTTFAASNAGGWISDALTARGFPRTTVRKTVQSAAFILAAAPLLVLPPIVSPAGAVALVAMSAASNAIGLSAFGVNHLDVAPRYAGVLMGISNTFATIPGIIGVAATGFIWRATGSFAAVFYLTAGVYLIGMAGYLMWASADQKI